MPISRTESNPCISFCSVWLDPSEIPSKGGHMTVRRRLGYALCVLLVCSFPVWGQVEPVPIPGGDMLPPLFNQFFPGVGAGFDGLNADPHGITNFRGTVAMGYTNGTATDNKEKTYNVITDIRVYQGDYVGAEIGASGTAGASKSGKAHGTFVEI